MQEITVRGETAQEVGQRDRITLLKQTAVPPILNHGTATGSRDDRQPM
jgi:hypothetical protein